MSKPISLPPALFLAEALRYDGRSGALYWNERPIRHFYSLKAARCFNSKYAGTRAGSVRSGKGGYKFRSIKITHGGITRDYLEHRVVWKIVTGEEPPSCIDHVNHDATDNRWDNIRDGSEINSRNASMYTTNTSGVTGVSWSSRLKKWLVQVCVDGKVKRFGEFEHEDIDLAAMEAMEVRREIGFDPAHGLEMAPYRTAS